ncbi:Hypothetical_protein [Hexamita inflata]|uniref:Hypothetical_protein n=1 Tax=Hexamita inflata TaxID=28002 RepID=A0AA86TC32_9EUKA|nr:Hypothetical protein HINF_LOCUS10 [Hexamita inflata]CAI9912372.1 Hypothetical protein HINF_LOCUS17 [Hexamita inflata]
MLLTYLSGNISQVKQDYTQLVSNLQQNVNVNIQSLQTSISTLSQKLTDNTNALDQRIALNYTSLLNQLKYNSTYLVNLIQSTNANTVGSLTSIINTLRADVNQKVYISSFNTLQADVNNKAYIWDLNSVKSTTNIKVNSNDVFSRDYINQQFNDISNRLSKIQNSVVYLKSAGTKQKCSTCGSNDRPCNCYNAAIYNVCSGSTCTRAL